MYKANKAFTLIELIVSISIIITISIMTYLPYSHYQNKAKLKISSREISQSFYEAKNMAVSWIKDISWNKSIWIYITNKSPEDNKITFFSYPHDINESLIDRIPAWTTKILKENPLQDGIKIDGIKIDDLNWYDNLLFYYDSINWKSKIFTFNSSWKTEIVDDKITIIFSYKNSTSDSLKKKITYYKKTNIIDYN